MYSAVEQAIKAGIEAIQERDNRIAALEAQLAERVKVKLLEWVQDNDGGCFYAETELGIYIAWDNGRVQYGNFRVSFVDGGSVGARSKAQADYERRILSALEATPPAPKHDDGSMTPEEIRLENLKQMATYGGPIVSFEVREPYYLASCDHCGWVGSTELCGTDSYGDDSDVYCPRCHESGADCGKVAGLIATPLASKVTDGSENG